MSERFGIGTVTENVSDFGKELVHSAFVNPYNAVSQIADKAANVKMPEVDMKGADNKDSFGAKAGATVGFVVDYAALALATKGAVKPVFKSMGVAESGAIAQATTMGLSGGMYGGIFTPSDPSKDLLTSRIHEAGIQAGTFATMSLAGSAIGGNAFEGSLLRRVGVNAASGGIGGATNAILSERLNNDRWASGSEILGQATNFAAFGAAFAGVDYAIGKQVGAYRESKGLEQYPKGVTEMLTPFKRLSDEPLLAPREGKFDSAGAFNPTATRLPDGDVAILYRAQDQKGVSTVGYARTGPDGVTIKERSDEPVLAPRTENEQLGIEDPRVTADTVHPDQYDLTATKWDGKNAQLADWTSTDLKHWNERGIMMPANEGTWNEQWTKSGSIVSRDVNGRMVPEKIDGKYWMYYMGSRSGIDELGLASSLDGVKWTDATNEPILPGRPGQFDSNVVEPGPAAVLTDKGINLVYSGGSPYEGNRGMFKYQTGLAVFSKDDPTKLLFRSSKPVFSPETPWEIENSSTTVHQVPNVVFPQGIVPDGKNGYLVYYGAADSYVGVAHTHFETVNRFGNLVDALQQSVVRAPAALNNLEDEKNK
ncbi:MAG TPA: hypothetical protein V6C76_16695 [Drouetiella sp.]